MRLSGHCRFRFYPTVFDLRVFRGYSQKNDGFRISLGSLEGQVHAEHESVLFGVMMVRREKSHDRILVLSNDANKAGEDRGKRTAIGWLRDLLSLRDASQFIAVE